MPIELAPFSQTEYDRRIALTRAAMDKAKVDVIFVTDPSKQAWLWRPFHSINRLSSDAGSGRKD